MSESRHLPQVPVTAFSRNPKQRIETNRLSTTTVEHIEVREEKRLTR